MEIYKYLETAEEIDDFYKNMESGNYEQYIDKIPFDIIYDNINHNIINFNKEKYINFMDNFHNFNIDTLSENIYSDCKKISALGSASEFRRYELMEMLLNENADPNIRSSGGYTCLELVIAGHGEGYMNISNLTHTLKCIKLLLDYNADTNIDNVYKYHSENKKFIKECQEFINQYSVN